MEVTVMVAKVTVAVFVAIVTVTTEKVTKQRSICDKLVRNGLMMDNYIGCDSSCNSYNIG